MLSITPEARKSARHALLVLLFYSLLFTLFFSPVLFRGSYLAPGGGLLGDTLLYYLTYFESPKLFWDGLLGLGLPMTADPQVMAWYPPSMLLSLVPGGWNLFVLAAYVLAACFAYGYAHALTESKLAGLVAGTVYGMSGFMIAHQGHTTIIHVAVWLPLVVWSLEMLRRRMSRGWLAAGCAAVACCVLAGHLQMTAYCLLVAACYSAALGWAAPVGRARYYAASFVVFAVGLGLAALQLVPAAELARESTRADFTFADFVSYSLPLKQAFLLLFPASLGGLPQYGATPYFGAWNLTEVTGYVGLLAPLLAAAGFVAWRRKAVAIFWLCVAGAALLLALGDQTPLARLTYHLPVVNKFRAPARHLLEMSFAASVLAGLGARAVLRGEVSRRALSIIVAAGALLMGAGLAVLLSGKMAAYARAGGVAQFSALPWKNAAVGVPLLIFLAAAALAHWHKRPASPARRALVLSLVVIDLASFGWFYNWRFSYPKEVLDAPAAAAEYRELLRVTNQRVLAARGTLGAREELPPNLSRLWNVPNAAAHGPLVPSRTSSFLSVIPDTGAAPSWADAGDQCLNLAAVRYVFLPRDEGDMNIWLGRGCDHPAREAVRFELPAPVHAAGLRLVSRLACAVPIKDGEEVARVVVTDAGGNVQTRGLVAGRDSSEWSYDCPKITLQVRHGRAQIFSSFTAKMDDEPCLGHFYSTEIKLDAAAPVRAVEVRWAGDQGALTVERISLVDESGKLVEAVSPASIEAGRWRFHAGAGGARVYENTRAMPRAWLAREAVSLSAEDALKAIKTSRLPDGREFDPARTALLEEPSPLQNQGADDALASARVTGLSDTFMEVETSSSAPAFLLTSDAYYAGWEATLDGATRLTLLRADYALRGVAVPAGRHVVRFDFRPKTFYFGATVSAVSSAALAALLALATFSRRFAGALGGRLA